MYTMWVPAVLLNPAVVVVVVKPVPDSKPAHKMAPLGRCNKLT